MGRFMAPIGNGRRGGAPVIAQKPSEWEAVALALVAGVDRQCSILLRGGSAFSRLRELGADALAVDLIDDPEALATALPKLEHFHSGLSPWGAHLQHDARARPWRSHPGAWERISRMAGA